MIESLASYKTCIARITEAWAAFQARRLERLAQQARYGEAAEKVAEDILEDLFAGVLDWSLSDINHQVEYADITLTRFGIKELIIETKRPGALAWNRHAVDVALEQALRYAHEQKVRAVAVSDGTMLYAADLQHGGLADRVFCSLESTAPVHDLWWLSMDGLYRPRADPSDAALRLLPETPLVPTREPGEAAAALLHPKYHLPSWCFAYVGNAAKTSTWKLPYLHADGTLDDRRLPKAIQSILSNYRGARVSSIPEPAIPAVLVRLGKAAHRAGKMPGQNGNPAQAYAELADALEQLSQLDAIKDA